MFGFWFLILHDVFYQNGMVINELLANFLHVSHAKKNPGIFVMQSKN